MAFPPASRTALRRWPVALLLAAALPGSASAQWQKNEYQLQKEYAEQFLPAPLVAPRREGAGAAALTPVRIRFHADPAYRAEGGRWQENMKVQLQQMNQVVGPAFGLRFEVESFRRWERSGPSGALGPMLAELEKHDPGTDVDWVVGLVASLPMVSMSIHDLGMARVLGRHFVLRGMSSLAEMQDFERVFKALERIDREKLYGIRKQHKEMSVFLHEWAHTLGAFHVENPTRIMSPGYSQRTGEFSVDDAELIGAAVQARLGSRGRDVHAIDWSPLHQHLKKSRNAEWRPAEKQELLALTAPRPGVVPSNAPAQRAGEAPVPVPPPFGLRPLPRGGIPLPPPEAADRPPAAAAPSEPAPAAASGRAAGGRQAGAPEPAFASEARTLLRQGQRPKALALLEKSAAEVATRVPADTAAQAAIARVYAEAGAVTAAERTLSGAGARAAETPELREAAAEVQRLRRRMGLPKSAGRFQLPPSSEPEYAEVWDRVRAAMNAGDLRTTKTVVDAGLRKFPGAPGLITADCELLLRQDRPDQAARRCREALTIMDDLPRAHYLLGCIQAESGQTDEGVTSLKRAIKLDPRNRAAWDSLSDLMRTLGRSKEFRKFASETSSSGP